MVQNVKKLFTLSNTRDTETVTEGVVAGDTAAVKINGMNGASGKQIALFVGGGFVAALIIFYLIANWDYIGNGGLCFVQNVAGMNRHYHFPMRDGSTYGNCTAEVNDNAGVDGDGN